MNTVDLQRMRKTTVGCAAVAAFAVLGTYQASAEVAHPNLVPAKSAYIISLPDTSAFWSAWEANGLFEAYKKIMAMPDVEAKVSGFRKELSIIEGSLGFKLDGPTLSQVFSSSDVYTVAGETASDTNAVALLTVADEDKLNKLLDLAEKAAAQAAAEDASTTETAANDDATTPVRETEHAGVKIKIFEMDSGDEEGSGKNVAYAKSDKIFIVANTEDAVKQAIDRTKAPQPGADTVASSEEFKKIDAGLANEKGELYFYGNQEMVMNMQSNDDMPAGISNAMQTLMDDLAPLTYYGASVKFAPKEISSYSYGLLKDGTSDSMMLQYPGNEPLKVVSYIPENTMLAGATSLFNAQSIYDLISGVAGSGMEDKLSGVEMGLGFSVKNDMVPAIGNEVAFALNDVKFGGLLPTVDATIMLGVKDKAKMQKVVEGVERLAQNAMAARADDSESTVSAFTSSEVEGQTLKSMENVGLPGVSPTFTLTDEFLIIGSTKAAVENSVKATGGTNLGASASFTGLGNGISANANVLQYANISRVMEVAKQVTGMIPAVQGASGYIDAANVMESAASVSRIENGAAIGRGVLKLK